VIVLVIGGLLLFWLKYVDWPARPASPDELSRPIARLSTDHSELIGSVYVYDFWGNFIDTEHLWKIHTRPELLPVLVEQWRLKELTSAAQVPAAFWSQPPYWWKPHRKENARYFMSAKFVAGERGVDGDHYLLMYDEEANVIFAWAKLNF
jgi:hypothetical protein